MKKILIVISGIVLLACFAPRSFAAEQHADCDFQSVSRQITEKNYCDTDKDCAETLGLCCGVLVNKNEVQQVAILVHSYNEACPNCAAKCARIDYFACENKICVRKKHD